MAIPLVTGGVQSLTLDTSTTLEDLTSGIRFYLREMGQNVIEIGKCLILAKELVPHGEWMSWLDDNFGLTDRTARNFMSVASRFGATQMIQLLSLPVGVEEKFIAEKTAESKNVAEMSVKMLRVEIQKYKAKLAGVNGGVEGSISVEQASVRKESVEEPLQSVKTVENGSDTSSATCISKATLPVEKDVKTDPGMPQNSLEQFFGMMKALATGGNLQNIVAQSASKDIHNLSS